MPELPEVETTRLGILPHIRKQKVTQVIIRNRRLRWPIPYNLNRELPEHVVDNVQRRAKYLLFHTDAGTMIVHLGMSGSLSIVSSNKPASKHDHMDIYFGNRKILRLTDPRRFGSVLWTKQPPERHKLLRGLGPEPLSDNFNADYLYQLSRGRRVAVKNFIMNSHIVVGIGNIYASEALYLGGINPKRAAKNISLQRYKHLVTAIRTVLNAALESGGSTLRDFSTPDGKPGYFQHHFKVYGKTGLACEKCKHLIRQITLGQRSTFYCPHCQK